MPQLDLFLLAPILFFTNLSFLVFYFIVTVYLIPSVMKRHIFKIQYLNGLKQITLLMPVLTQLNESRKNLKPIQLLERTLLNLGYPKLKKRSVNPLSYLRVAPKSVYVNFWLKF